MTKQGLIDFLNSKESVDGVVTLSNAQQQPDGVNRYVATIRIKTSEGAINYKNIAFYVENEGSQTETVYWEDQEPLKETNKPVTFSESVYSLINAKITDNTIKGAVVENINDVARTAYIRALVGTTQRFAFVTDSNNDGNLEITLL